MNTKKKQRSGHWGNRKLNFSNLPHAFKDLAIHETSQFTLYIAVRYVLHHCLSQDIDHGKVHHFPGMWSDYFSRT